MAKTYKIDNPPGGSLTCSDDQMGIVDVIGGSVYAQCISVPGKATKDDDEIKAARWAYNCITGKDAKFKEIVPQDVRKLFKNGKYVHEEPWLIDRFENLIDYTPTYYDLPEDEKVVTFFIAPKKLARVIGGIRGWNST